LDYQCEKTTECICHVLYYVGAVSPALTFTTQQFSVSRVGLLTDTDGWFEALATLWG